MKISYIELKRYKYELQEDLIVKINFHSYNFDHKFFKLTEDGILTIKKGYKWDGVSGPMVDSDNTMIGGCIHDALYQMIRLGLVPSIFKHKFDDIMKDIFDECGMNPFRSSYAKLGVELFGHSSCIVGDIHIPETKVLEC